MLNHIKTLLENNPSWFCQRVLENIDLYNQTLYRGTVVDNGDPDKQGKIKVFIPQLMSNIDGIWCRPLYFDRSQHIVPKTGDIVLILFENADFQEPVYIGNVRLNGSYDENLNAVNKKIENQNDYWFFETRDRRLRIRYSENRDILEIGYLDNNLYVTIDGASGVVTVKSTPSIYGEFTQNKIVLKNSSSTITLDPDKISINAPKIFLN